MTITSNLLVERPGDQESLIPVGQAQDGTPERDELLEYPRPGTDVIERKPERRRHWRGARLDPFDERRHLPLPSGLKHAIGVEKQHPTEAGPGGAERQLPTAPALAHQ